MIAFNKPYFTGREFDYIRDAILRGKLSGDGNYTHLCHDFFKNKYGFRKCLLTSSCTDALEMAAILCNVGPGDEVIVPSYTFVSTANAFILRGATVVFADSRSDHPGIDESAIERLITPRTKVIVPVHYAGVACDMDSIMRLAEKYNLFVVEDAAQAVDSFYNGRPLGGIGHLAAFSFHETKNIISGEGGMLVVNDERFIKRAEIVWEKGTNRSAFWRGEVNKYGWVDVGSSFLPSEIIAAFLYAQLEQLDDIQARRKSIWNSYYRNLKSLEVRGKVRLPFLPAGATNNAHMFYMICDKGEVRDRLLTHLKQNGIHSVFHYLSLHQSDFFASTGAVIPTLSVADHYSDCLLRLPLYYELTDENIGYICQTVLEFYKD